MSLRQAFVYACLIVGCSLLFMLLLQLMAWFFIWMTTHFPGAFGIFLLLLLGVVALTLLLYFGYKLVRQPTE